MSAMISKDKTYQTRNGCRVIIASLSDGWIDEFPVIGLVEHEDVGWEVDSWTEDGFFEDDKSESRFDLIEVKGRIKRTYWVNLYNPPEGESRLYLRHETAMENRLSGWVGCAKIEIDIEEGEQQI